MTQADRKVTPQVIAMVLGGVVAFGGLVFLVMNLAGMEGISNSVLGECIGAMVLGVMILVVAGRSHWRRKRFGSSVENSQGGAFYLPVEEQTPTMIKLNRALMMHFLVAVVEGESSPLTRGTTAASAAAIIAEQLRMLPTHFVPSHGERVLKALVSARVKGSLTYSTNLNEAIPRAERKRVWNSLSLTFNRVLPPLIMAPRLSVAVGIGSMVLMFGLMFAGAFWADAHFGLQGRIPFGHTLGWLILLGGAAGISAVLRAVIKPWFLEFPAEIGTVSILSQKIAKIEAKGRGIEWEPTEWTDGHVLAEVREVASLVTGHPSGDVLPGTLLGDLTERGNR